MLSKTRDGRDSLGDCEELNYNMTIGKTVGEIGEMYTNYTVESVELAGYLP